MNVQVSRDDGPLVRAAIEQHHYLHRWPDPRSLPFAYRLLIDGSKAAMDGRPHGVVVFKKPQHHRQRGLFGYPNLPTAWQVLDMARVWIHPDLQTRQNGHSLCMFSRMVSRALRQVQWDWLQHHPPRFPARPYHIEIIISYCEMEHHDGTAYRAASFQKFGLTSDGAKEVYVRRLRSPRRRWQIDDYIGEAQLPLLATAPIDYGKRKTAVSQEEN